MGRHLTAEDTALIIKMSSEGKTQKHIAQHFNVSQSTVNYKLSMWRDENRIDRRKTTRKLKVSDNIMQEIKNNVQSDPYLTIAELKEKLELPLCKSTISKYLGKLDLKSHIVPRKFIVKPIPAAKRVEFAKEHKDRTVEQWSRFVFTDESGMDNSGKLFNRVRRPRGTRFDPKHIRREANPTLKRVNWFSWITYDGPGEIHFVDRMNSERYCWIISHMISTLKEHFGDDNFYIIHDNAKFATSEATKKHIIQNKLEKYFVEFPTYSPDANIIENPWAIIKKRVKKEINNGNQPQTEEDFLDLIATKWNGLEVEIVRNLYRSLPTRMLLIIEAQGQLIKY